MVFPVRACVRVWLELENFPCQSKQVNQNHLMCHHLTARTHQSTSSSRTHLSNECGERAQNCWLLARDMWGNSWMLTFGKQEELTMDGVASHSKETDAGSNGSSSEQAAGCCICLVASTWRQDATFCWVLPSRRVQLHPSMAADQVPLLMEMTCSFHVAWQHFCLKAFTWLKLRQMKS